MLTGPPSGRGGFAARTTGRLAILHLGPAAFLRGQLLGLEVAVALGERQPPPRGDRHRVAEHAGEIIFVSREFFQPANHFFFGNFFFFFHVANLPGRSRLIKFAEEDPAELLAATFQRVATDEEMVLDTRGGENPRVERR